MSNQLSKKETSLADVLRGENMLERIAEVVPQHMTAERMVRVGLLALNKTPKLTECTRDSFLQCMMDCSSLGLEPDGRRAHLIPYGKKCTLIVDYKGLIELAKRSGEVATWKAETVKQNDVFTWRNGKIEHEIDFRNDRGDLQCVYSIVVTKDGETDTEVMTLADVEAIRKRSKTGDSGPWVTDFSEMAKKTVIRRHSKRLTLSPEFHTALEKDGDQIDLSRARNVTPRNEEITTETNPFDRSEPKKLPAPNTAETLSDLMEVDGISEPDLLMALADAGVCRPEISGISELSSDQINHTIAEWDTITKGVAA